LLPLLRRAFSRRGTPKQGGARQNKWFRKTLRMYIYFVANCCKLFRSMDIAISGEWLWLARSPGRETFPWIEEAS
jgi:hypothetical protein